MNDLPPNNSESQDALDALLQSWSHAHALDPQRAETVRRAVLTHKPDVSVVAEIDPAWGAQFATWLRDILNQAGTAAVTSFAAQASGGGGVGLFERADASAESFQPYLRLKMA